MKVASRAVFVLLKQVNAAGGEAQSIEAASEMHAVVGVGAGALDEQEGEYVGLSTAPFTGVDPHSIFIV